MSIFTDSAAQENALPFGWLETPLVQSAATKQKIVCSNVSPPLGQAIVQNLTSKNAYNLVGTWPYAMHMP